jgi:hypothetical protein
LSRQKAALQSVANAIQWPGSERRTLDFFVVSYAPQTLKGESVNIAVVVVSDGFVDVRLVRDWQRVAALDPDADLELLTAVASEIRDALRIPGKQEEMLRMMEDSWSNAVRLSPRKGILTENPATEIEALASHYL